MKKLYYLTIITLFSTQLANAQWIVYGGDAAPADNVDVNWNASNGSEGTWTVQADMDTDGNNLVLHESLGADKGMYKTDDFDPDPPAATFIIRVKAGPTATDAVEELDLHLNGFRDQLIINTDNTLDLTRSGASVDLNGTLDVTQWNVFRVTIDASSGTQGDVNVYLNEDPTPVLTAVTTHATTAKYLRFGDGQSSKTYSSVIDFLAWELSGAYSPADNSLPPGLLPTTNSGNWITYGADFAPADNIDVNWNASNGSEGSWTVEADPNTDGNNLVLHESLGADKGMYKTDNFDPDPPAATFVIRVKAGPTATDAVEELDLHLNGFRDQLIINTDNTLDLTRSGASVDLNGVLDVTQWNIFRVTIDASSGTQGDVNVYLNEDPTPVLTAVTTHTTTAKYLRFGDGQSSKTYSSLIDFITWDLTGAFSPSQISLPANLIPSIKVGDWILYEADLAPADNIDVNWNASNGSEGSWTVKEDPDADGNNLVLHESLGADKGMYKTDDFDPNPTAATFVIRVKAGPSASDAVEELDLHLNGLRDQLIINTDNTLDLTRSGASVDLTGTLDVTQWNIFRVTIDASAGTQGDVNVYLNENPTPVLTAVTSHTTTAKYLRFGDGQGSKTYSSEIDFIVWDLNGAFSPEETALPEDLIPTVKVGEWTIYTADETPENNIDPNWNASNGSEGTWVIEADAENAGNNIVVHESLGGDKGMYKTDDFDPDPPAATVVIRVKAGASASDAIEELDLHLNGFRDQLIINTDNTLDLTRSGASVDLNGSLDVGKWNVFRITIDASTGTQGDVNVYLNENPIPVLSAITTHSTSAKYLRFGDGQGSKTYSSEIDFIAWDVTGAFSPAQRILPPGLIPGTDIGEEPPGAKLGDLTMDGVTIEGFSESIYEYNVVLPHNTTEIPTIVATPLDPAAEAFVFNPEEVPGTTLIPVSNGDLQLLYFITFEIALDTDNSLASLTIDGIEIPGFEPTTTNYEFEIPSSTLSPPVIGATPTDPNVTSIEIVDAEELPGITTIIVTPEDETADKQEYQISFLIVNSDDASLADLKIGGSQITSFDPATLIYTEELSTFEVPEILAIANHPKAIPTVSYPDEIPGTATVTVKAEDGLTEQVYTIEFTTTAVITGLRDQLPGLKAYPNPVVNELYLEGISTISTIQLLDVSGKLIKETQLLKPKNAHRLNMTYLKPGQYVVLLMSGETLISTITIIK